jgi:extracellular elastinolytic metalloproteinase
VSGGVVTFNPVEPFGDEQKILNIFYYCCYMHDFFYLLGFDERAGNFQEINFSGFGLGGDSVEAHAHSGAVTGTANMSTPDDGMNPTMNMGLVTRTDRHTAFSADVVYHEFVHGVTNRVVGGRMNTRALREPQSRSMGEGWSDYFALTVQNFFRDDEIVTTGTWVVDDARGIRGFPYNDEFPDNFGNIGTGRYTRTCGPFGDQVCVHSIGEIWCATLMSMNRRFVENFGKASGYNLCWRIVVDGLRLTRANPSFLDARDGILDALDDLLEVGRMSAADHQIARRTAWETFARYGMGPNARSIGASLLGIEADFDVPLDL